MFDFDNIAKRRNTNSYKWDVLDSELPMWVADMDFKVFPEITKSINKRASIGAYGYSVVPNDYYKAYCDFWYRRHNTIINKNSIIFSTGVVPALSSIVRKMTTVAENVLIMAPVYNIFYNSIYNNGRNILSSDLVYKDGNYSIDFLDLENKLALSQTTMMILCNPHNPIGKIWTCDELNKIGELCLKYNVLLVSDEIHADITSPNMSYNSVLSLSDNIKNNSIVLLSATKCFNMAGIHAAAVVVENEKLYHKVNRGLNTDEVAEPNFFAVDATITALNKGDLWLDEMNEYVYNNKKLFKEFVEKNIKDLHVVWGDATYLLWVDISQLSNDAITFCRFLREKTGLFVTEGNEYGKCANHFFRINLATSKENVLDALDRLKQGVILFKNSN